MQTVNEPWTVLRLLDWTKDFFGRYGIESPRLCAEILLAECLQCKRMELYLRFEYHPSESELASFRANVKKASEGQPVAYLVGRKEFYSLSFKVTSAVLIPRPETELLVDQAVSHLRKCKHNPTCWDVCTGSGCVAIAVAKHSSNTRVLATDLSFEALKITQENADALDVTDRVMCAQADLLTLPEEWNGEPHFDAITANPPYVADGDEVGKGVEYEPAEALRAGPEGLDALRPLIACVPSYLKAGGVFCVEFGRRQADTVRDLLLATNAFNEPSILKDHQAIERAIVAVRR